MSKKIVTLLVNIVKPYNSKTPIYSTPIVFEFQKVPNNWDFL